MIPVIDKSELNQYGLDGSQFVRKARDKIGGFEWHGPCPNGCGRKQLVVSNGKFWCRLCGYSGKLDNGGEPLSDEQMAEIQARIKAEEENKKKLKSRRIAQLNKPDSRGKVLWQVFHDNLLKNKEQLAHLNADGIPLYAVQYFGLGYNPRFTFWIEEKRYTAPAITFPILWGGKCFNIRHRILMNDEILQGNKYRPIYAHLDASYLIADYPDKDYIVFVEGEKKAIVLWANCIPAIALWGVRTWHAHWFEYFKKQYKRHYIIFDSDNSQVLEAAEKFASYIPGAKVINLGGKPDDLIVSGAITPEQILERIGET